uniref:Uncharacterized protein n=1 Tax=Arundo donax TaxID=35708 RepID=A0A0A8ZMH2_ARUDO
MDSKREHIMTLLLYRYHGSSKN